MKRSPMSPEQVLQALVAKWRQEGVRLHAPADEPRVHDAFAAAGGRATRDLVRLYAALGGMDDFEDNGWTLWPPEIVAGDGMRTNDFGTAFSDYLLSCWVFRARPVSDDVSEIHADFIDGTQPLRVAASVDAFLQALAFDPMSVLEPRTDPAVPRRGGLVTRRADDVA